MAELNEAAAASMEYGPIDPKSSYTVRPPEGFEIIYPKDNQLFLDLDSEYAFKFFLNQWRVFFPWVKKQFLNEPTYEITTSKSGNRHVIVNLPFQVRDEERIAWQATLGSDLMKELFSIMATWTDDPFPTLLFERQPEKD